MEAVLTAAFGKLRPDQRAPILGRWQVMQDWIADLSTPRSLDPPPVVSLAPISFHLPRANVFDSLAALSGRFSEGELSPIDLTAAMLERIEAMDKGLHSYVTVMTDTALADAARSAARHRSGTALGPLDGIPISIKDIIDVAGSPTTCHSRLRSTLPVRQDAEVTRRLRRAGAIILGKTATHEFAFGGPTDDVPFPQPRNPWDVARYAGGSSSGSAVSLAAELALGSLGSDTGGSLRIPSAYCGIISLKPTFGALPVAGVFPLAATLDHVGPMARNVADCGLLWQALSPLAARLPLRSARDLVIGEPLSWIEDEAVLSGSVLAAQRAMGELLVNLGATLVPVAPPPMADFRAVVSLLTASEAFSVHEVDLRTRPQDYSDVFRARVAPALFLTGSDLAMARQRREALARGMDALFDSCDVLLMPATANTAPLLAETDPLSDPPRPSSFSQPTNLSGHPALTIRAGFDAGRLPIGLQLVGRRGAEAQLLALGTEIEAAMPRAV